MKWHNQMDDNKEYYKTAMGMLESANTPLRGNEGMRASTEDPIWAFVAETRRDIAKIILSFACWAKMGKSDLREASISKLLEVALELKVLRMDVNDYNVGFWGVIIDNQGKVIKGGIKEVVRRGLVIEDDLWYWWHLEKMENGDVFDEDSTYGEKDVMYGRLVDGVAEPVTEGLFVDCDDEEDSVRVN